MQFSLSECKAQLMVLTASYNASNLARSIKHIVPLLFCRSMVRRTRTDWTMQMVDEQINIILEKYHCIPPLAILREKGWSGMFQWLRKQSVTMGQLREKYQKYAALHLQARNGKIYRSYAEMCFVDFLWARNITFKDGEVYPEEYNEQSGQHHGVFDFHFESVDGRMIDVEIFGGARTGGQDAQKEYKRIRQAKEIFNADRSNFLAIEYDDCYDENKLINILEPFLGRPHPSNILNAYDANIPSVFWSLADQVLTEAEDIASHFEDRSLPAQHWFNRIELYADRVIQPWEQAKWGVFLSKTKRIGGLNKLRSMMGRGQKNRHDWTRDEVLHVFREMYCKYQKSPSALMKILSDKQSLSPEEAEDLKRVNGAKCASTRKTLFPLGYKQACEMAEIPFGKSKHSQVFALGYGG